MSIIENLKQDIRSLEAKIKAIQDECAHPAAALNKTHKANQGNYCKADDKYWTVFECTLCEKRWEEEGSK